MAKILVVGSANMDTTYLVPHIPEPGETILARETRVSPGGKGANQAVAAARLGGDVAFLGRIGNDANGAALRQSLVDAGVDVTNLITDETHPTGSAVIIVADDGQNSIIVDQGANAAMTAQDIWDHSAAFNEAEYIILQLEISMEAVHAAKTMGELMGKQIILNPAPAAELSPELLSGVYCLVPNETEATAIFYSYKNDDLPVLAYNYGVKSIIVTLGSKGCVVAQNNAAVRVPSMRVKAVDTTGAGDCFVGALAVALSEDNDLMDAAAFANQAAAISVTREGAQRAMPVRSEIEE